MEPQKKQRYEKRFFLSLFIIVLVLFAAGSLYNNRKMVADKISSDSGAEIKTETTTPTPTTPDPLSVVSGIVYRHLVAYNLVCTEANMPLKKYPEYFSKKYTPEIQAINLAWEHRGKSLESVLTDYDSVIYPKAQADIKKELLDIERNFVKTIKAKEANVPLNQVEWTEKQENNLNLTDACMLFDEAAKELVEAGGFETMFRDLMKNLN